MSEKTLLDESVEHFCIWGMRVAFLAVVASTIALYLNGGEELSQQETIFWGLLLERVLAACLFVYNKSRNPAVAIGG